MSNERYLIISYFVFAIVCCGLGVLVHQILRKPFATIVDAIVGSRSGIVKRALMVTLTAAGVLGFLGFSYNQKGCVSYAQVIKSRDFLVDANLHQVQNAVDWIAWTVLAWGVLVVMFLKVLQTHSSRN